MSSTFSARILFVCTTAKFLGLRLDIIRAEYYVFSRRTNSNYERRVEEIRTLWLKGEISDYEYERAVSIIEERIDNLRKESIQPAGKISPLPTYEKKPTSIETKVLTKEPKATMGIGVALLIIGFILLLYEFYMYSQFQTSLETSTRQVSLLFGGILAIVGFVIAIYGATSRGEAKSRMVR